MGKPATIPRVRASWMPFSMAGMKFLGMEPPKVSFTKLKSPPRGSGFMRILQSPNCPWPPVCFLWRPWPSAAPLIVSRYGTRGFLRLTSTL